MYLLGTVDIIYFGHSSFRFKGKSVSVVTDPYDARCGKFPKDAEADIVTVSHNHSDHNQVKNVVGSPFVVDGPGEYEIKGVSIIGVSSWHDDSQGTERGSNTAFVFEFEGVKLLHLGDLGHKLTTDQLEEIGSIDVVFVPVGGLYTIDAKTAVEVVRQVDPWVVVPMHYQQPGLEAETFGKLTGVDVFLKELGAANPQTAPKLSLTSERLPTEMQVVVLERK